SRRRHTRFSRDWSSDVCSSDLLARAVTRPLDAVWNPMVPNVPMVRRGRLIASPPVERGSLCAVALLLDPDTYVGDGELQVLAEAVRGRAEAACAPVVDRRDGDAQIRGQIADIDQGLQAPRGGLCFGVHDEQVHGAHRS